MRRWHRCALRGGGGCVRRWRLPDSEQPSVRSGGGSGGQPLLGGLRSMSLKRSPVRPAPDRPSPHRDLAKPTLPLHLCYGCGHM